jgi:hypothetical protein
VTDCFQDGRRHRFGNSSASYKMGNYYLIPIKIGTQTKKHMLSSKIAKRKCAPNLKMAAAAAAAILKTPKCML